MSTKFELSEKRNHLVVKSNKMIQDSRYKLSTQQQKIVLYLISKIKPEDEEFKEYIFDLKEYGEIVGIKYTDGGSYINSVKESIQALSDKSFWLRRGRTQILTRWISKATLDEHTSLLSVQLDNDLKPELLNLKEQFTKYELSYVLAMQSKYSIRLYELFKSYSNIGLLNLTVDEFRSLTDTEYVYKNYAELNRNVISKSIKEINKYTDLQINFKPIKNGKVIIKLEFIITKKELKDRIEAWQETNNVLDRNKTALEKLLSKEY